MTRPAWLSKTLVVGVLVSLPGALIITGARDSRLRQTPAVTAQESEPQRTVWNGVFTKEQAQRGATAYQKACGSCHGANLKGKGDAPALIGAPFFDRWSELSVQDLFFTVQISMSHSDFLFAPSDTTADIVSFLLRANKMPAGADALPISQEKLRQILITGKPATP